MQEQTDTWNKVMERVVAGILFSILGLLLFTLVAPGHIDNSRASRIQVSSALPSH